MALYSMLKNRSSRRRFLAVMGFATAGAAGVALGPNIRVEFDDDSSASAAAPPTPEDDHASHANTEGTPTPTTGGSTADEMDAMHEAGVKAFPAATAGLGGQPLEYELDGDVKVFKLSCDVTQWEYAPGQMAEVWAYNGVVPGPEIRVTEGDKLRVIVTNNMQQSTSIHYHGVIVPNNMDGVPFITQPPIKPGETFTYEFTARVGNAGSHMYHSHHNAAEQVTKGLLGAFIIEPKDPTSRPAFDREYTMILNDGPIGGFTLNGKGFPATQPVLAKKGERILVRFMNEGLMIHPMHLHGMPMQVIAQDGWLLPQPYLCDTLNVAPGQRFDVIIEATEVGVWAFHCHILTHAESAHGMFGMVTAMIVEE
jgi:FtsP/CotA-like multicopper oxidase with cupredoxin domain